MASKITDVRHPYGFTGAGEKRLDTATDGTLWLCVTDNGLVRFLYSRDQGSSWALAGTSDLKLGQAVGLPSFHIDADGFAHVAWARWNTDPQVIVYARGVPLSGGGGWKWSTVTLQPGGGRLGLDVDLVAVRNGSGWAAWIAWSNQTAGQRTSRIDISSSGTLSIGATIAGPTSGQDTTFGALEFAHTGDGKTAAAAPHLFLLSASIASSRPIELRRARYESGAWTWEAPVTLETARVRFTTATMIYDGARACAVWAPDGGAGVRCAEWDGVSGSVTRRDLPGLPAGTGEVAGLSMAHDPATDDLWVAMYGTTGPNLYVSRFTRTAGTWSTWALLATRTADAYDNKVQMERHAARDVVNLAYGTGTEPKIGLFHVAVARLARTPKPPVLQSPAPGQRVDFTNGGVFSWDYQEMSASDVQQAWQLRRVGGSGTQFWNAGSETWGSTATWNPGAAQRVAFPAGAWPTGTYSWSVNTLSSGGVESDFASGRTVASVITPLVRIISPSGLHYADSTPLVEWIYTSGVRQRTFEVRVMELTAGTTEESPSVWRSGVTWTWATRSTRVGVPLRSGVSYRVYLQVSDDDGGVSDWTYSDFALSLEAPTGPLLELAPAVNHDSGLPRARLQLRAQSNLMDAAEAQMTTRWVKDTANSIVNTQNADLAAQLEAGLIVQAATGGGTLSVISMLGSPPAAPYGEAPLLGPLNFPVYGGRTYTFLAHVKSATDIRSARASVRWQTDETGAATREIDLVTDTVLATVGTIETTLLDTSLGDLVPTSTLAYVPITITATAPFGAKLARVRLEILGTQTGEVHYLTRASFHPGTSRTWQPGGYAEQQALRVQRSLDEGATWQTLAERVKPDYRQEAVAYDRTMPFGREVLYRAVTDVDLGSGGVLSSAASSVARVRVDSSAWAIRDPADEAGEQEALVTAFSQGDEESATVFRPAGRHFPIVDSDGDQAGAGSLTVYVRRAQARAMQELLTRGVPLVVQSPTGTLFRARFLKRDYNVEALADRSISADYVEVA